MGYLKKLYYIFRQLLSWYYQWTDTDMCVSCKKSIRGKMEKRVQYYTTYGPMHHSCGNTLAHSDRYGGQKLPKIHNKRLNNMSSEQHVRHILVMNRTDLLTEIMKNPEYLTDAYYVEFGNAIRTRYDDLIGKQIDKL